MRQDAVSSLTSAGSEVQANCTDHLQFCAIGLILVLTHLGHWGAIEREQHACTQQVSQEAKEAKELRKPRKPGSQVT